MVKYSELVAGSTCSIQGHSTDMSHLPVKTTFGFIALIDDKVIDTKKTGTESALFRPAGIYTTPQYNTNKVNF